MDSRKTSQNLPWVIALLGMLLILVLQPKHGLWQRQLGMLALTSALLPAQSDGYQRPQPVQLDQDALERAQRHLETAVLNQPVQRALGLIALTHSDIPTARGWLQAVDPTDPVTDYLLGESYLPTEQWSETITHWEQAGAQVQLLGLAAELAARGELDVARQALVALLPLSSGSAAPNTLVDAHKLLADVLVVLDRPQEAVGHYRQVISLRPESAYAYARIADILFSEAQYADALDYFNQAYTLDFSRPRWILVKIGRTHAALGDWPAAADALRNAYKIAPDDIDVHTLLIEALCESGSSDDARRFFRRLRQDERPAAQDVANRILRSYETCVTR